MHARGKGGRGVVSSLVRAPGRELPRIIAPGSEGVTVATGAASLYNRTARVPTRLWTSLH